jgi:UDP-N-acetylglucosamine 2-epimerase (non-hydrolysing)
MSDSSVAVVFGTRPEAIKMAPVIRALKERKIPTNIIATGQHRELLDQVLRVFEIEPDANLKVMTEGQSLFQVTSRVLEGLAPRFKSARPSLVLVQGDTTTVFATALAAFYLKIPVGHVEAGLRTGNRYNPFPEEMNRTLTSRLAALHFAPTERARDALLAEGLTRETVHVTGNTVIDALLSVVREDYEFAHPTLRSLDLESNRLVTVTTHRRESWGAAMEESLGAIREVVDGYEDVIAVFPVHPNTTVREAAARVLGDADGFYLIDPLDYLDFAHLMARSTLIFTDSGGVQEEAPSLGVPVLVLRETTERPEGIEAGTAKLVGTSRGRIVGAARDLLGEPEKHAAMARRANPYGDGKAAGRIVDIVERFLQE